MRGGRVVVLSCEQSSASVFVFCKGKRTDEEDSTYLLTIQILLTTNEIILRVVVSTFLLYSPQLSNDYTNRPNHIR